MPKLVRTQAVHQNHDNSEAEINSDGASSSREASDAQTKGHGTSEHQLLPVQPVLSAMTYLLFGGGGGGG